ncbi:MAG: NAD(P)/FAD-dependent oxidoreductase, partial [Alphaproteobacteria bacterium]
TVPLSSVPDKSFALLNDEIKRCRFVPPQTGGWAKAEVTKGGVDVNALSSATMECRTVPGLYFAGEVVDVTGELGGFNLHWAWASGTAAGRAAARKMPV